VIVCFTKVIACLNKKDSQFFDVFNKEGVYIFKTRVVLPIRTCRNLQAEANRLGGKSFLARLLAHLKEDDEHRSLRVYAKSI
jgi:hypothetical protein